MVLFKADSGKYEAHRKYLASDQLTFFLVFLWHFVFVREHLLALL